MTVLVRSRYHKNVMLVFKTKPNEMASSIHFMPSHCFKRILITNLEYFFRSNKINELVRKSQKSEPPPRQAYNPTYDPESDFRKILRNSPEILATPIFSSDDDYTEGPFRFKQLLRPTLGPTESLRKRKVRNSSGQSPWMSDSSQDSTSSKQAFAQSKRRPQISMGVFYNS